MGFLDNLRGQAKRVVDQHGGKIATGLDKAAAAADKRTGGKHRDKIHTGVSKAKQALDRRGQRRPDIPDHRAEPPAPPPGPPPAPPPGPPPAP